MPRRLYSCAAAWQECGRQCSLAHLLLPAHEASGCSSYAGCWAFAVLPWGQPVFETHRLQSLPRQVVALPIADKGCNQNSSVL